MSDHDHDHDHEGHEHPPLVPLTEDELRTIARDVVESHGVQDEPDLEEMFHHAMAILQTTREEPCIPDRESMRVIASLIRRSQVAVELPSLLVEPTVTIPEDELRAWARYFRADYGNNVDPADVRHALSHEIVGEIDEDCITEILDLLEGAEVKVQLPGDRSYRAAPYPGKETLG